MQIKKIVILLYLLAILFSCDNKSEKDFHTVSKQDSDLMDQTGFGKPLSTEVESLWDSVRYYKDFSFTAIAGFDKLEKSNLTYPYVIVCYKKPEIKISAVFEPGKVNSKHLFINEGLWSFSDSSYNAELQKFTYNISYYKNQGELLTINYEMFEGLTVLSASILKSKSPVNYTYNYFYFTNCSKKDHFTLQQLVKFTILDFEKLSCDYVNGENMIENKTEYSLTKFRSSDKSGSTVKKSEAKVEYNSYFFSYFFNH